MGPAVESPRPCGTEVIDTGQEAQVSGFTGQSFSLLLMKWWPVTEHQDNPGTFIPCVIVSKRPRHVVGCPLRRDEETKAQRGGEAAPSSAARKGQTELEFEPSSA